MEDSFSKKQMAFSNTSRESKDQHTHPSNSDITGHSELGLHLALPFLTAICPVPEYSKKKNIEKSFQLF